MTLTTYRVVWEIDIDAETPEAAAREALKIQRDPDSIAEVFSVEWEHHYETVDLTALDEEAEA